MSDGDLLLARIIADPACDAARLVYADWLQENGQPERAEFVRVQVELARGPDGIDCETVIGEALNGSIRYDCWPVPGAAPPPVGSSVVARFNIRGLRPGWFTVSGVVVAWCEKGRTADRGFTLARVTGAEWKPELLARERELWSLLPPEAFLSGLVPNTCWRLRDEPLRERQHGWVVRRGFIEEAKLAAADWIAHGDAVRAAHPVTRVTFTGPRSYGVEVWYDDEKQEWPVGEQLAGKTFAYHRIEHFIAERLAHKPLGYRTLAVLMLRWPGVEFVLPPANPWRGQYPVHSSVPLAAGEAIAEGEFVALDASGRVVPVREAGAPAVGRLARTYTRADGTVMAEYVVAPPA